MLQVFISGPFSAPTPWETHKNVLRAEEAAARVAHLGAMPQCPHTNSKNMVGIQDWQFWMDGCLEWLKRCDAVLFLPNWESSRGAKLEHAEAVLHDTPRFYDLASLKEWIENG